MEQTLRKIFLDFDNGLKFKDKLTARSVKLIMLISFTRLMTSKDRTVLDFLGYFVDIIVLYFDLTF